MTAIKNQGIVYMLIAAFCFSISGACTKIIGTRLGSIELVLFRNSIGVLFILWSIFKKPPIQEGGKLSLLIFRGVIGTLALYTFFYSITNIGLAEAITYQQSYPIFLSVLAVIYLKEYMSFRDWLAVVLGFVGICFIFLPQFGVAIGAIKNHSIGILNAILTALAYLSISGLSKFYDRRIIVLSFMLSGVLLPMVSLALGSYIQIPFLDFLISSYVAPVGIEWFWIIVLAMAALVGQIYLTKAFSFGKTGQISAIGYSNIIFSMFFGILLGDPFPSPLSFVGILLIIVCGVVISFKTQKTIP